MSYLLRQRCAGKLEFPLSTQAICLMSSYSFRHSVTGSFIEHASPTYFLKIYLPAHLCCHLHCSLHHIFTISYHNGHQSLSTALTRPQLPVDDLSLPNHAKGHRVPCRDRSSDIKHLIRYSRPVAASRLRLYCWNGSIRVDCIFWSRCIPSGTRSVCVGLEWLLLSSTSQVLKFSSSLSRFIGTSH